MFNRYEYHPTISSDRPRIGIDLGTTNILIYVENLGVIYNEPSVIALELETDKVIAVGKTAARMLGRGHSKLRVVKPLNQGVITDLDAAKKLIEHAFDKLDDYSIDLKKSTVLLTCSSEMTQAERESLTDLARRMGVIDVFMEEEVKAGAIGAGLDIFSSNGVMVVDMGGGTCDVAVLAIGDIVLSETTGVAGNYIDEEIKKMCQYRHGILIGEKTAESVKNHLATVVENKDTQEMLSTTQEIAGRDILTGLPKKVLINQKEVQEILLPIFEDICNVIKRVLQQTPAELCADIIVNGIVLNGGLALIEGMCDFISNRVELEVRKATNPLTSIAEGSRTLLQNRTINSINL